MVMDPPVVWETQAGEQEGGWPWQEWRALPPKPAGHAPGALVRSAHPGRCHGGVGDEVRAQNGDSAAERTSGVCLAGSELGGSGPCGRVHPSLTGQWPRVAFPTCGPRMSSLGGCVSCSGLIWPAGSPQQLSTHGCPLVPPWLESWSSPRPCSRPCPPPQRWPLQRFPLHAPPVLGSSQKAGPHRLPLPLPGSLPCLGSTGMLTGSSIESPHLLQGLGECRWEAPSPGPTPPIKCTWSGSDPSRPHTPTSPLGVTEGVTHMVSGFPGCQLPAPASLV